MTYIKLLSNIENHSKSLKLEYQYNHCKTVQTNENNMKTHYV